MQLDTGMNRLGVDEPVLGRDAAEGVESVGCAAGHPVGDGGGDGAVEVSLDRVEVAGAAERGVLLREHVEQLPALGSDRVDEFRPLADGGCPLVK